MNRIEFFLRAKTQYNLHSPFVFNLYREVLFASLAKTTRNSLGITSKHQETLYKVVNHLQPQALYLTHDENKSLAQQASVHTDVELWKEQTTRGNDMIVVAFPHRNGASEKQWNSLQQMENATAILDLYHTGIILFNPKLSKQLFLLR